MSGATKEHPSAGPGATSRGDERLTWTITTTIGYTATGYLPVWADDDPSATDVPPQRFATELADITHHQAFSGQLMAVSVTDAPGTETVILSGSIDCAPYSEDPTARLPVVNLQLVDDYWLHNLDPDQLATIATQLRTQADHLDHEVRPALIAARDDWTTHHSA
ncbi:DUF6907 domain-containing protein [Streptomyces sp. CBMA29]|uniref:DUF6907 domain-containing protein n=1 Tax=Streptomyces sp. CBMA29 TaxID=1896314 RepID=UPI001662043E|nr:hypothetical protein [Streptomyces sp. CBMA29]MBD0739057.1 hypothetical protein [Streptomyces sp. CBMA29]